MGPQRSSCGQRQPSNDVSIFPERRFFSTCAASLLKTCCNFDFCQSFKSRRKEQFKPSGADSHARAPAPVLHSSSPFLLILDLQTVASYSIWLTAARRLVRSARSYLNSGTVEPEVGVRTLQGFTSRDIRAQPKGSGIFFVATWVSFVETRLNDCRRCRAEIMSLTALRVFQIHGPTLLLTFSKAPLRAYSTRINHTLVGHS